MTPTPPKTLDWRAEPYLSSKVNWRVWDVGRDEFLAGPFDEPTARLIAAAPDMAHMLTAVAEACEENLADYKSGRFLFCELVPFLEATAKRARAALKAAGRAPG